jgi:hypothetical protein
MTSWHPLLSTFPPNHPSEVTIRYSQQPQSGISPAGHSAQVETLLKMAPMFLSEANDMINELSEPYYRGTARFLCQRFRILNSISSDLGLEHTARAARHTAVLFELLWLGSVDLQPRHWSLFSRLSDLFATLFEKLRMVRSDTVCELESGLIQHFIRLHEPIVSELIGDRPVSQRYNFGDERDEQAVG